MAKFYPSMARGFHGSLGEKAVFQALSCLNDEYVVFYSYRWLGSPQQRRSEGEADFLILHPRKGILSVEVKAGGVAYRDGQWIQINRNTGEEKVIDPLGQAAESQYRVRSLLRGRFGNRYIVPVGRAVWFTSVSMSDRLILPAEAAREIILDQNALDFPEEAVSRAFAFWRENLAISQELNSAEFKEIVKFLMPSFHLVETLSSQTGEKENSYVQLTERQGAILHFLREQPMAAIHGPAGTGKTLLAVEKLRMLAGEGKKVLYLCFNEFLLSHLRASEYDREHITIHNVRTLAEELLHDNSIPLNKVIPAFQEFFANEYDDELWPYPNIVVDEGQDIDDGVLSHLCDLSQLYDGIFYVFYDRNQYIMRKDSPEWLDKHAECRLVLYRNCRNTSEIAAMAGNLIGINSKFYVNDVHGMKPKVVLYKNSGELQKVAEKFVKEMQQENFRLEDIVILSVHSVPHSKLQSEHLAGVPVSTEQAKGKVWFTSVRKFKGLEAKAVLLIDGDVEKLHEPLMQRILYVGCSRANDYLQIALLHEGNTMSDTGKYYTRLLCE